MAWYRQRKPLKKEKTYTITQVSSISIDNNNYSCQNIAPCLTYSNETEYCIIGVAPSDTSKAPLLIYNMDTLETVPTTFDGAEEEVGNYVPDSIASLYPKEFGELSPVMFTSTNPGYLDLYFKAKDAVWAWSALAQSGDYPQIIVSALGDTNYFCKWYIGYPSYSVMKYYDWGRSDWKTANFPEPLANAAGLSSGLVGMVGSIDNCVGFFDEMDSTLYFLNLQNNEVVSTLSGDDWVVNGDLGIAIDRATGKTFQTNEYVYDWTELATLPKTDSSLSVCRINGMTTVIMPDSTNDKGNLFVMKDGEWVEGTVDAQIDSFVLASHYRENQLYSYNPNTGTLDILKFTES